MVQLLTADPQHQQMSRAYFDHNATTPPDPAVIEAMARALAEDFGNASSVHHFGQRAKALLDEARTSIGQLIGAEPAEIVFTSGGTESDNLALRGAAAMTRETGIVSVMHANNEIGTIQPIADLAAIAHEHGALFHTDAVQSVAKIPVDVRTLGIDLLALSAHKFNGPKGAGALWIKRGTRMQPILTGGKHERNRRAGTENVPAIGGLGVAAQLAAAKLAAEAARVGRLR